MPLPIGLPPFKSRGAGFEPALSRFWITCNQRPGKGLPLLRGAKKYSEQGVEIGVYVLYPVELPLIKLRGQDSNLQPRLYDRITDTSGGSLYVCASEEAIKR